MRGRRALQDMGGQSRGDVCASMSVLRGIECGKFSEPRARAAAAARPNFEACRRAFTAATAATSPRSQIANFKFAKRAQLANQLCLISMSFKNRVAPEQPASARRRHRSPSSRRSRRATARRRRGRHGGGSRRRRGGAGRSEAVHARRRLALAVAPHVGGRPARVLVPAALGDEAADVGRRRPPRGRSGGFRLLPSPAVAAPSASPAVAARSRGRRRRAVSWTVAALLADAHGIKRRRRPAGAAAPALVAAAQHAQRRAAALLDHVAARARRRRRREQVRRGRRRGGAERRDGRRGFAARNGAAKDEATHLLSALAFRRASISKAPPPDADAPQAAPPARRRSILAGLFASSREADGHRAAADAAAAEAAAKPALTVQTGEDSLRLSGSGGGSGPASPSKRAPSMLGQLAGSIDTSPTRTSGRLSGASPTGAASAAVGADVDMTLEEASSESEHDSDGEGADGDAAPAGAPAAAEASDDDGPGSIASTKATAAATRVGGGAASSEADQAVRRAAGAAVQFLWGTADIRGLRMHRAGIWTTTSRCTATSRGATRSGSRRWWRGTRHLPTGRMTRARAWARPL